jgi:single-stranded DNA-binding protein
VTDAGLARPAGAHLRFACPATCPARSSCGRCPRAPRWRDSAWPAERAGATERSGVERTNYFTVEVYGPQANLCAERLGKGPRVVVDGELDWREWTDQEQKRREAVVLRARQILFERAGSTPLAESEPGGRNDSLDGDVSAGAASPASTDDVPF